MQEHNLEPGGYINDAAEVLIKNTEVRAEIARKKKEKADAELERKLESVRSDPRNDRFKKKKEAE